MKIVLDGKFVPCLTREDLEKHHPNLMKALDKIAEADVQKPTNTEELSVAFKK